MLDDWMIGAAIVAALLLALLAKFAPRRELPRAVFTCGRCRTATRHDDRTRQAWRDGRTTFFCRACHLAWLDTRPARDDDLGTGHRRSGGGKRSGAGVIVMLVVFAIVWGASQTR